MSESEPLPPDVFWVVELDNTGINGFIERNSSRRFYGHGDSMLMATKYREVADDWAGSIRKELHARVRKARVTVEVIE